MGSNLLFCFCKCCIVGLAFGSIALGTVTTLWLTSVAQNITSTTGNNSPKQHVFFGSSFSCI